MADEAATQATESSAAPSIEDGVSVAQLADEDAYLDMIGMNDDETEFNPEKIIAPKGAPEAKAEGDASAEGESPEPEAVAAEPAKPAAAPDAFMAWLDKHTPEQIESLLKATQSPGKQAATEAAKSAPEPEIPLADIVKPLAARLTELTGEDAAPAVQEFSKALLKQVGNVYQQQIAQRDEKITALSGQLDLIVAHIERQEVGNVLAPLAKTYPDLNKPGMRDQVEARMRSLHKTGEYATLKDLARDAALLTFGATAVAANMDAKAKQTAAARAGQPNQPNAQTAKPTKASYDAMCSRLAEMAARGEGTQRMLQVKKELGW